MTQAITDIKRDMKTDSSIDSLMALEEFALEKGAYKAKVFDTGAIVVDERVRMKCQIPLCPHFGHCLTCPPNAPTLDEFRKTLALFSKALMVQTQSPIMGDMDKAVRDEVMAYMANPGKEAGKKQAHDGVAQDLDNMKVSAIKLHKLINETEGKALMLGYHFATGFIGGECMLCAECVGANSGEKCRLPYQARPSMEAVGIDVYKTSSKAGLPFELPPKGEIIWTGMILVE